MRTGGETLAPSIRAEFGAGRRVPTVVAGLLGGFIATSLAVSLASLIFTGPLRDGLGVAISASLIGGSIITIVTAWASSAPGMVGGIQDATAAVIAAATASIAATAVGGSATATAFVAVGLTTIGMGLAFWAAGRWRLGRVLRFVPYPVILGFVGATGMVLFEGAVAVLWPSGVNSASSIWTLLVPGLVLGAAMFGAGRYTGSRYAIPLLMITTGILVHVWANLGPGRAAATIGGWFLGPFEDARTVDVFVMSAVTEAEWSLLAGQSGVLLTTIAVGLVSFLLNAPAVAATTGADIDVDADLRPVGIANVAAGLIGSLPGYLLLSDSVAVYKVAGLSRIAGVISGFVGIAVVIGGTSVFSVIPTVVVGGVLVFIALNFLFDALVDSISLISRFDYLLVAVMAITVLLFGFGLAVIFGLLGAVVLFVLRYAQIDVVSREMPIGSYPGLVDRSPEETKRLTDVANKGHIIELKGFVFFGTARLIADRVAALDQAAEYVVVDITHVTDIDSSASTTMRKAFHDTPATVVISGMQPPFSKSIGDVAATFEDLAEAVTWVEDQLLGESDEQEHPFEDLLAAFGELAAAARLNAFFNSLELAAGEVILSEGATGAGLFYIESGKCGVVLGSGNGQIRIRQLHAGTFVGEISMYDRDNRATASVVADTPCRLRHLPAETVDELESNDPSAAMLLHRIVAGTLAHRLRYANDMIRSLRG